MRPQIVPDMWCDLTNLRSRPREIRSRKRTVLLAPVFAAAVLAATIPDCAFGWGDEGHQVVGAIADHYLDPTVRAQVNQLLAGDTTGLTSSKDILNEATWADHYRDSDRPNGPHYKTTHTWHFVDIELSGPNLDTACFGHPTLPAGTPASSGPLNDCAIDKINAFIAELKSPSTSDDERRMAVQFLLHFVGDIHQPLHASDDNDSGGNSKNVTATGLPAGNLHHYWDTEFVQRLGTDPGTVAQQLIAATTDSQVHAWSQGTVEDWAQESFGIARDHVYGLLPTLGSNGKYALTAAYVDDASQVVPVQLQKAGVRLAFILNQAMSATAPSSCTATQRAAAIPPLSGVTGIVVSASESTTGARFSSVDTFFTSTLQFDGSDPVGLPVAVEGILRKAGWKPNSVL